MNVLFGIFSLQVVFLIVALVIIRAFRIEWTVEVPTIDDLFTIGLASLGSIFLLVGAGMVQSYFGLSPVSEAHARESTELLIAIWLVGLTLAPIAEEFLFRGAIQGGLRSRFGAVASITVGSSLFGIAHVLNFSGTPLEVFSAVVIIGVVSVPFAITYELTNNLTVPVASHAIYNLVLHAILFSVA